ncbi:hypothetical protein ACI65C_012461, partial [Semiaphis heraclei]
TNEVAAVPIVWIMSRNCDSETEMCWWPNVKKRNSQLGYKYFNSKQVYTMIKERYKPNKNEGTYLLANYMYFLEDKSIQIYEIKNGQIVISQWFTLYFCSNSNHLIFHEDTLIDAREYAKVLSGSSEENDLFNNIKSIELPSTQQSTVKKTKTNQLPIHPLVIHKHKNNRVNSNIILFDSAEKMIFDTVSNSISSECVDFCPASTSTRNN